MPILTFPLLLPQMLWAVLLATSLSAQNGGATDLPCGAECARLAQDPGDGEAAVGLASTPQHTQWDNPTCTRGVVSVSRGQRAVMACNISNPLLSVAIYRSAHGEAFEPVFSVRPPGCFCRGGWQLQVRGGVARLVIEDANHTQAGCYKWYLQGLQRNIEVTTLNVSGGEKLKTLKEAASCPKALKRQKASEDADVGGVLPPRGEPQTGGLDLQGSPTSRSLFSLLLVACIFTGFSEIESRGLSTPSLQAPPRPSAAPPPASRARPALPRPRPLSPGPSPPSRPRPRNAWLTEL
ncbi:secreted and transmembrane protein 1 isoform X2 [Ailuropoda melanoleuca]|uniref:secreted and transmembrane protein 1 isoform X2 n=1 Tax=Ailuropoda melanoleuca TaxID=9646 RepID=UPI001493EFD1|nr:secreted and transmembrane protein 1 isoform X2 [Ailuropoda melanoleuca]